MLQLIDQQAIGQRHRGLRGERLDQALVGLGKHLRRSIVRVEGVDQLQDADDLVLVVLHRHRQERARTVAGHFVELARTGKIEALRRVGIGDIHRFRFENGVGGNERRIGRAIIAKQRQITKSTACRLAASAPQRQTERVRAHDLEVQGFLVFADTIKRAAVGMRDRLGGEQDVLEQAVDITLVRERGADLVELLEARQQVVQGIHFRRRRESKGACARTRKADCSATTAA